jgi:hypothetical protein
MQIRLEPGQLANWSRLARFVGQMGGLLRRSTRDGVVATTGEKGNQCELSRVLAQFQPSGVDVRPIRRLWSTPLMTAEYCIVI